MNIYATIGIAVNSLVENSDIHRLLYLNFSGKIYFTPVGSVVVPRYIQGGCEKRGTYCAARICAAVVLSFKATIEVHGGCRCHKGYLAAANFQRSGAR